MSKFLIWRRRFFKHKNLKIILFILVVFILVLVGYPFEQKIKITNRLIAPKKTNVVAEKPKTINQNWTLQISKLDISVPIILNVDGTDKDAYFKALQNGIAQMSGTASPGEVGNVVIFGHSNFYEDDPGHYKKIFSTLDQLAIGDEIKIISKGQTLIYIVSKTELVDPTDVSVIQATTNKQLTLLTCWPPGTIDQRLVVIADLKD